ncbi:protein of unknown function [Bradyrhizobium vignae]|uniref:Uncharacterized protein n=1 Tax=Bradyrhizobium vignae TaxID=1549949 RepID=A0A2U3PSQ0_9BRAD|nr:protein of unknown function [Bradyrhizobium vignae]
MEVLEIKGRERRKGAYPALLNAVSFHPYHLRAGRYQCFGTGTSGCTQTKARPDGGRVT